MTTAIAALCASLCLTASVFAADPDGSSLSGGAGGIMQSDIMAQSAAGRVLALGVGKSMIVELPNDASEVLVADPKIANAIVRSARKAYIIGIALGETNVIFFDAKGQQILGLDVHVGRDLGALINSIRSSVPGGTITVQPLGDSVMLGGTARSAADAQTAVDLATRIVGDVSKVVNAIAIEGREQVLLKVSVAEVQRSVIKQLGIDFNGTWNIGSSVVNFATANPFSDAAQSLLGGSRATGNLTAEATLRALEENGVLHTLAEPNLTAVSGESAKFLAGGEFPIISGYDASTNTPSIEFKQFGVSLNFTPVVLSGGRISLKVSTEVSEISSENTVQVAQGVTVPGLKTRRADTTVEVPSGGSLVMAGMLQQGTKNDVSGTPYLKNLPVLGQLFRSQKFQRSETELAIFVTPYLAQAVAPDKLAKPQDGFADPTDPSSVLLGRFNKIYTTPGKTPGAGQYRGQYGFIID